MSHIFISYSHDDKAHLDKLVSWLLENDFAEHELWFDRNIEGGNNWRDEIASALDEAFAVLVIVSTNSVKSLYCTYEWAYAMGQGIPTIPLIFDDVRVTDMPAPLASKQKVDCNERIPDYLKEQVRQLRSVPPKVAVINKLVYEIIFDTHRRFFILGWLGEGIANLGPEDAKYAITDFVRKAAKAHQELQDLMVDKAFAISGKQHRHYWLLQNILEKLSRIQPEYQAERQNFESSQLGRIFAQFESKWLPAFEYCEGDGWWRKWVRSYFEWDLENEHNRMKVFAEMIKAFPTFDVHDAENLISYKIGHQKLNKSKTETKP